MAVEIAMGIQPGLSRIPKGVLDPICERYGVGKKYPSKLWKRVKTQIDNIQELDLSNEKRSGRHRVQVIMRKNSRLFFFFPATNQPFFLSRKCLDFSVPPPSVLVLVCDPQVSWF